MRKHLWKVLTALAVVCMTIGVAAACGPDEPEPPVMYALTYVGGEGATGTAPEAESYAEGDTVTLKANPFAKEGYDFKAWSFGGTEYQPAATFTMPASNVTFTATWTEKPQIEPAEQFTLTYSLGDYTGGTAPTALTVETGTEVTLATPPAWAEHTFAGWKIGTETLQAGAKYTVTGNVTATAQWTLVTYAVTFDLDGGEMDPAPTQAATAKDGTFTLPATEPAKDGFHFAGWSDGTTTYEKGATYTMPGAAVKFTAQWTAVTHAELVGGYWVGSFTQGEGDEAVLTSVICVINPYETPTEVEMDEETVALKVGRSLFKAKMTVGDVTLYNTAMVQEFYWLEEEGLYTNGNVAFKVIDGALAFLTPEPMDEAPSDAKFTAMTRITAPAVPEFPASLYGRVEDDLHSPFTQIAITKDSETGTIGITLNGKEQKIEWFGDIAYLTESTAGATASVVGGTLYSETVEPEEEDGDPVTTFYLIPPEDEDVIVLAEGPAPTLYKVELYKNKTDTTTITEGTYYVEKNGKLENLDIAQDDNYTFVGWADKTTDEIVDLTDITEDLAVYEKWSVKPVHVEFNWGNGTFTGDAPAAEFELGDATLEGGGHWDIDLTEYNEVQAPADHTFSGWDVVVQSRDGSSSSNSLSKDTTSYTVYLGTQSVTFTAIFAQNDECVVTFRDQHGNQTAKTLKRGDQLGDALQDPDPCIGYVFKEWNTQPDGEGVTVTAETIVPDEPTVEYYAIWEDVDYTIIFYADETEETTIDTKTECHLTDSIDISSVSAEKPHFDFVYWYYKGPSGEETPIVGDQIIISEWIVHLEGTTLKLYAKWGPVQLGTVEVDKWNDNPKHEQTMEVGDIYTLTGDLRFTNPEGTKRWHGVNWMLSVPNADGWDSFTHFAYDWRMNYNVLNVYNPDTAGDYTPSATAVNSDYESDDWVSDLDELVKADDIRLEATIAYLSPNWIYVYYKLSANFKPAKEDVAGDHWFTQLYTVRVAKAHAGESFLIGLGGDNGALDNAQLAYSVHEHEFTDGVCVCGAKQYSIEEGGKTYSAVADNIIGYKTNDTDPAWWSVGGATDDIKICSGDFVAIITVSKSAETDGGYCDLAPEVSAVAPNGGGLTYNINDSSVDGGAKAWNYNNDEGQWTEGTVSAISGERPTSDWSGDYTITFVRIGTMLRITWELHREGVLVYSEKCEATVTEDELLVHIGGNPFIGFTMNNWLAYYGELSQQS